MVAIMVSKRRQKIEEQVKQEKLICPNCGQIVEETPK